MLPCMLYSNMTLVINNLVSFLCHKLAVKDPFFWVQTVLKNFFSDRIYWPPQVALLLPKEVGGQGLAHLASRNAAFSYNSSSACYVAPKPGVEVGFLLDLKNLSICTLQCFIEVFLASGTAEEAEGPTRIFILVGE